MTAEAPSAVSAGESQQSVMDEGLPRRPLPAAPGEVTPGADTFFPPAANGVHSNGASPDGEPDAVEDRTGTAEQDSAQPEAADAELAQPDLVAPEWTEEDFAPATTSEPETGPELARPGAVEAGGTAVDTGEPRVLEFDATASDTDSDTVLVDAVLVEPVDLTDGDLIAGTPDDEPLADEPVPEEVVVAEVAEQLGSVVGEDVEVEPAEFAAAAVLDVLRASGWADTTEATELRAEATRLRELLSEVIRDHRAREANAAGGQNQQLYWLIPLLRAAHGVAFGSLGAKVALRTAVQEVPPEVLASAGLRIDYGVEPVYEDQD
jgi:hypothetical protein